MIECPTTDQLEEFLGEISTMKRVGKHPNVVKLLGFCTQQRPLIMIMEYVGCGDLVIKFIQLLIANFNPIIFLIFKASILKESSC